MAETPEATTPIASTENKETTDSTTAPVPSSTTSVKSPCENECGKEAEVECQQCDAKYCTECFDECHQKPPAMRKHTKTTWVHPIKQKLEESLQALRSTMDKTKEHEAKIQEQIKGVDSGLEALHKEKNESKTQINSICDALIQKINDHRVKLFREIDSIQEPHEKTLQERREVLNSILAPITESLSTYQTVYQSQDQPQVSSFEKQLTATLGSSQTIEPLKEIPALVSVVPGSSEFSLPSVINKTDEQQKTEPQQIETNPTQSPTAPKATTVKTAVKPAPKLGTGAQIKGSGELEGKLNKLKQNIQQAGEHVAEKQNPPSNPITAEDLVAAKSRRERRPTVGKPKPVEYLYAIPLTYQPRGIAINPNNSEIYVCDYNGDKIHIYSPEASNTTNSEPISSITAQNPYAVAVDKNNILWVSDYVNSAVHKVTRTGDNILTIENKNESSPAQLVNPRGIAVDRYDNVYVCDENLGRILAYDNNGRFMRTIGAKGSGSDQLNRPQDLRVEGDKLMVCDRDNNRIQVFSTISGKHLESLGGPGYANGQLQNPESLMVDKKGRVVVGEYGGRKRVQWLGKGGEWLGEWDDTGAGKLNWACSLVENEKGEVFVSDINNKRLVKLKINL